MNINQDAFEYAISKIDDGFIFEFFAQSFLSGLIGYDFIPVGGTKDKGIDGIQHLFGVGSDAKTIVQISTESNTQNKIDNTINKLNENKVSFERLRFVTNRNVNNIDSIVENIYKTYGKQLIIHDIKWFKTNCNSNQSVINSYNAFSTKYLYEYDLPGKHKVISNLDEDPRLYVFLRQQFDSDRPDHDIDSLLVDSLIMYSLEGTDPDKGIFLSKDQVRDKIRKYIKFDIRLLDQKIDQRLATLTTKPRKIKYHTQTKAYCLPYETRLEIQNRNLLDEKLAEQFFEETESFLKQKLKVVGITVRDMSGLISSIINSIFYRQGLEFSNFVLNRDSTATFEQNLQSVVSKAVDESPVVPANKEKVKELILITIRDIIYNGSETQSRYLRSLSKTYLMMFMLHWEPKISVYFHSLASELKIFIDNSILIPAFSEYYLESKNRRHWNLLMGAKKAGISMFINDALLNELITHFKMIKNKYEKYYRETEDFYLNDDIELLYIDEILIRAYFYARKRESIKSFNDFLDNFINPKMRNIRDEVVEYLREEFGIIHVSNESWNIKVDQVEKERLVAELKSRKSNETKANNDAEMILAIYYLRARDNETASSGIFGYKTWWLSKDTNTYIAVENVFKKKKYEISCYIRPDFIFNYIALMPSEAEVKSAYEELFPTMLGVNLSYHLPHEVSTTVRHKLLDFRGRSPIRVRQILKDLSNRLKSDATLRTKEKVELFFDEELKKMKKGII